jgi:acyl transferase domain-containing protein
VDGLRRISVNSFGFGGSNAHAIIDDAAHYLDEELRVAANHNTKLYPQDAGCNGHGLVESEHEQVPQLFVISAYDQGGVSRIIDAQQQYLQTHGSEINVMPDLAYTLFKRRSKLQYKAFAVARSAQELTTELERVKKSTPLRSNAAKGLNVAFVFCGQGAQYAGMAKELMVFEPFRSSLEACGDYLRALDPMGEFDLVGTLHQLGDAASEAVNRPEFAQPATTAVEIALVDLLEASGVKATSVVGHSSGEIAAAYASGLIPARDALRIAYYRGQVVSQVSLKGKMLAVALSAADAQKYIDMVEKKSVCVACTNSPVSVTLSGDADQIRLVQKLLDEDMVNNKLVAVETAYHSHHMQTVSVDYLMLLKREPLKIFTSDGPVMYSSVTGERLYADGLGAAYWVANMISPVAFDKAVSSMVKETGPLRPDVFLEVSPHSVFRLALRDILTGLGEKEIPYFPMMVRNQDAATTSLTALGELWSRGLSFKLDKLHTGRLNGKPKCLVDLPTYPWNHSQTYWHESHLSKAHRFRKFGAHDFLGAPSPDSISPQEPCWRGFIDAVEQPWIEHHVIQNMIMYPAAGMVIMAVEAAKQVVDGFVDSPSDVLDFEISKFKIEEPMVIPEGQTRLEYNFKATRVKESTVDRLTSWKYNFRIYTVLDSSAVRAQHTLNARGYFTVRFKPKGLNEDKAAIAATHLRVWELTKQQFEAARTETFRRGGMVPREFYERLNIIGLTYGRLFRNLTAMTDAKPLDDSESTKYCYTQVTIPNTKVCMPEECETPSTIHPAALDAMFQSLFVLGDEPMVPHYIDSIRILADTPQGAGTEFFGYAVACKNSVREAVSDITMWHGDNQIPVVGVRGLSVISMTNAGKAIPDFLPHHRHLCSQVVWNEYISSATDGSLQGTLMPDFKRLLNMMGQKNPTMRVLQIGGDPETVALVLERLALSAVPRLGLYTICSENQDIFDAAQAGRIISERKDLRPVLRYVQLGDDSDVCSAMGEEQFDVVLADQRMGIDRNALLRTVKPAGILAWTHEQDNLTESGQTQMKDSSDTVQEDADRVTSPWLPNKWTYRAQSDPSELATEKVVILIPGAIRSDMSDEEVGDTFSEADFLESYGLAAKIKTMAIIPKLQYRLADAFAEAFSFEAHGLTTEVMTLPAFVKTKDRNCFVISLLEASDWSLVYNISYSNYNLVHQLLQENTKGLLWVTCGAQMDTPLPEQSPFLGWARTVRSEEPDKCIVCVDVDPHTGKVEDWVQAVRNIFFRSFASTDSSAIKDTEFAVKDGRIYIPRLEPLKVINDIIDKVDVHPSSKLDTDAMYVVSGGLGGLGLDVLKWLADHGAKHLTVLSRSGPSKHGRAAELLKDLRERGVDVVVDTVDICDEEACYQVIEEIQMERPVKGIIQAAAVVKVRSISSLSFPASRCY